MLMAGGAILLMVVGGAVWWSLPRLIRARVDVALRELPAAGTDYGGITVSLPEVVFSDVNLFPEHAAVRVSIQELTVRTDPLSLVLAGGGIEEIHARGVSVRLPASQGSEPAGVEGARGPQPPQASPHLGGSAGANPPGTGGWLRWLERLAADGELRVSQGTVVGFTDGPLLRELSGVLRHQAGGFRFEGSAQSRSGEPAWWEMDAWPGEAIGQGRVAFQNVPLAVAAPLLPRLPWHRPADSRLGGELRFADRHETGLVISGHLRVEDAGVTSRRLAPRTVAGIDLTLEGEVIWRRSAGRLELPGVRVTIGEAGVEVAGRAVRTATRTGLDLDLRLPVTPCDVALAAIPETLLGELGGMTLEGDLSGRLQVQMDTAALEDAQLSIEIEDGCRFTVPPGAMEVEGLRRSFTQRVRSADGQWLERRTGPATPGWTSLREISPYLVHAVLVHEDAAFFEHQGFATVAIRDALVRDLEAGRFVRGASTISMQLARNLGLDREKHLARKLREVLLAWWLEKSMEKHEILELYLNVIEFGPNLYGIGSGSQHYFGREPGKISPAEAAFLACILPAPHRYCRQVERRGLSGRLASQMKELLRRMAEARRIDDAALDYGLAEVDSLAFTLGESCAVQPRAVPGGATPVPGPSSGQGEPVAGPDADGLPSRGSEPAQPDPVGGGNRPEPKRPGLSREMRQPPVGPGIPC
jgi:hypothetical protein